jgi:cell division protease FtsH
MSEAIGPRTVLPPPGQESPLGLDGVAPATKELIDGEIRRIVDECYAEAVRVLRDNRDRLDRLARRLLETETWTRTTRTPRPDSAATPRPARWPAATPRAVPPSPVSRTSRRPAQVRSTTAP